MSIEIIIKNIQKEKVKEISKFYEGDAVATMFDIVFEEIAKCISQEEVPEFANKSKEIFIYLARYSKEINKNIKVKFE